SISHQQDLRNARPVCASLILALRQIVPVMVTVSSPTQTFRSGRTITASMSRGSRLTTVAATRWYCHPAEVGSSVSTTHGQPTSLAQPEHPTLTLPTLLMVHSTSNCPPTVSILLKVRRK